MKGKIKGLFKKISPTAKKIIGVIVVLFLITITVTYMRKTVTVSVNGNKKTYVTWKQTVDNLFEKEGIDVTEDDKINVSLDSKLVEDMEIDIKKAVPVTVVIAGQEHEVMTTEETVKDTILEKIDYIESQGGGFDNDDEVTPSGDTAISKNMKIEIVQVEVAKLSETEKLPYNVQYQTDYDKDVKSASEVLQAGQEGSRKLDYKVLKYEDGREEKVLQAVTVISQPVDEIVVQGGSYFMASRSGEQIKLKGNTMTVSATAYYCGENAITATGRYAVRDPEGISTIAVDPSVIPLGSLVYVDGYGKAVAADTGSAIKGNIIDVYLNSKSECVSWGRKRGVEIGIIAYPGEW